MSRLTSADPISSPEPCAPYLTKREAATLANCSERTIQRAVNSGALPAFTPFQRLLLRESDVRAWVESVRVSSPGEHRPQARRRRVEPGSVQAIRAMDPSLR